VRAGFTYVGGRVIVAKVERYWVGVLLAAFSIPAITGMSSAPAFQGAVGPTPGIYVISPDGTGQRRLIRTESSGFSWSPDSTSIVLAVGPRRESSLRSTGEIIVLLWTGEADGVGQLSGGYAQRLVAYVWKADGMDGARETEAAAAGRWGASALALAGVGGSSSPNPGGVRAGVVGRARVCGSQALLAVPPRVLVSNANSRRSCAWHTPSL
jgi:hypothetical protein